MRGAVTYFLFVLAVVIVAAMVGAVIGGLASALAGARRYEELKRELDRARGIDPKDLMAVADAVQDNAPEPFGFVNPARSWETR